MDRIKFELLTTLITAISKYTVKLKFVVVYQQIYNYSEAFFFFKRDLTAVLSL